MGRTNFFGSCNEHVLKANDSTPTNSITISSSSKNNYENSNSSKIIKKPRVVSTYSYNSTLQTGIKFLINFSSETKSLF